VKIKEVRANNRRKAFEVTTRSKKYLFPYAVTKPTPGPKNRVVSVEVDRELGNEGFTYVLESGAEGTVHIDHVLEYNRDPGYVADMVLYQLTLEAQRRLETSRLSTRELIRKLGTSPSQFYRLLDQTNYRKSVRQMLALLYLLGCDVDFVVKKRKSA
jgi:hypothetical protein